MVIVNWNTRELVSRCISSVFEFPPKCSFDVWMIDNGSDDGTIATIQQRFAQVHIVQRTENQGFARACNQGLRLSNGRYVLMLNSDAEVSAGTIDSLLSVIRSSAKVGAVGPQLFTLDGQPQDSFGSLPSVYAEILGAYRINSLKAFIKRVAERGKIPNGSNSATERVDRVSFACALISRRAISDIGLLDESFAFYSEDYDFFRRLGDAGWTTFFLPGASAIHHWGASSSKRRLWSVRELYKGKRKYYRKHHGALAEYILRAGLIAKFLLKGALLVVTPRSQTRRPIEEAQIVRTVLSDLLRPTEFVAS